MSCASDAACLREPPLMRHPAEPPVRPPPTRTSGGPSPCRFMSIFIGRSLGGSVFVRRGSLRHTLRWRTARRATDAEDAMDHFWHSGLVVTREEFQVAPDVPLGHECGPCRGHCHSRAECRLWGSDRLRARARPSCVHLAWTSESSATHRRRSRRERRLQSSRTRRSGAARRRMRAEAIKRAPIVVSADAET